MAVASKKVAVITGASKGIGRATAQRLVALGWDVIGVARALDLLHSLEAESTGEIGSFVGCKGDVASEDDSRRVVQWVYEKFGKIDVLICNAGVGKYAPLIRTSLSDYHRIMDTSMKATYLWCSNVVPGMIDRKSGHILIVSSIAGLHAFGEEAVYSAAKAAQLAFADALDQELLEYGIKVTSICPGGVATDFAMGEGEGRTPEILKQRKFLSAEQMAEVIEWAIVHNSGFRVNSVVLRSMNEPLYF